MDKPQEKVPNLENEKPVFEFKSEELPFSLNKPIHLYEIFDMIETIDYIPTATPRSFYEQFKLYVDDFTTPTVFRLFIYFPKVQLWKSVEFPVGPSASPSLSPSFSPSQSASSSLSPSKSPSKSPSISPSVSPSTSPS